MIDLKNIRLNRPEIIFSGTDHYAFGNSGIHRNPIYKISPNDVSYNERYVELTVAESKPQVRTVILKRKSALDSITIIGAFTLSFPYVQGYFFYNKNSYYTRPAAYFTVTFSTKPASDPTAVFYEAPLPNLAPYMCMASTGQQIWRHASDVQSCMRFFWSTPFYDDRSADSGWYYLRNLFTPREIYHSPGAAFVAWANKTKENPDFIMNESFWRLSTVSPSHPFPQSQILRLAQTSTSKKEGPRPTINDPISR